MEDMLSYIGMPHNEVEKLWNFIPDTEVGE